MQTALHVTILTTAVFVATMAPASAHTVAGAGATNFQTTLTAVSPPLPGLSVRVIDRGARLQLRNIQCVRTSWARARTTVWFAKGPWTSKEVPYGDGMWVGSASTADHVRCARGRLGRGVAGPDLAARSGAVPSLASRRREPSKP